MARNRSEATEENLAHVFKGARGGLVKAWIEGVQMEDAARVQVDNLAAMPFIHKHIAVMPDVHFGMGATVGSVIPMKGAIIPAAVGVDIGCGMQALRTSLTADDLPDDLGRLRAEIERRVPHGRTDNGGANDRGAHGNPSKAVEAKFQALSDEYERILEKHPKIRSRDSLRAVRQIGTLGTGNHFVEVCLDLDNRVWIMLHSGSRGTGNTIGTYFVERAKEEMRRWFINLPDMDLAYFPEGSELYNDYLWAVDWAQRYARANRELMMEATLAAMRAVLPKPFLTDKEAVSSHHNYVSPEYHFGENVMLVRKGAVRVDPNTLGIIPGSMGAKSFIVRGKAGAPLAESFCSCSHGAGRSMSRTEAKKRFTLEDHIKATEGVECRKDEDVIDETPGAYKSIDAVMAAQADHVEVVAQLKQVLCVKG